MALKKPSKISNTEVEEVVQSQAAKNFEMLSDRDHVRIRPGMYIPNIGYFIYELADNGVDILVNDPDVSHLYKDKLIEVSIKQDGEVFVSDNACGLPIEESPKVPGMTIAELCMSELKAGTKFKEGVKSAGLNGVGASCINILSEYFNVDIYKDKKHYRMEFKEGLLTTKLHEVGKCPASKHGTYIHCKPDPTIWSDKDDFDIKAIDYRMKQLCYLNPELKIKVDIDYKEHKINEVYSFPEGVKAYVEDLTKGKEVIHDAWFLTKKVELDKGQTCEVSLSFAYTESYSDTIIAFTNNVINTDTKSSNLTGFKRGISTAIKESYENEYPKSKLSISAEDTREGIVAIINIKVPDPVYIGQGKDYLNMPKIASVLYNATKEYIEDQFDKLPNDKDNILNRVAESARVREASHKAKEIARKVKQPVKRVEKLAKCTSKDPEVCEIFFVEGDSAAGTAKAAREDAGTMAILPVFGKIPNVEELTLDKVLASDKLNDIINSLECGIGDDFDIEKVRYHKIVILADADVDGYHIATLYMTFFYRYMRPLLENGYVYLSCPPLYKIVVNPKSKNPQERFALDDEELEKIKEELGNTSYDITYVKGLGEFNAEELWQSTMNPETRTLIRINVEDVESADNIINTCMNKATVAKRKEIIMNGEAVKIL